MKAYQKYIEVGLIVVMALVVYLAYSFGYKNYIEKAKQTDNETATIRTRIDELTEKASHKPEWEKGISEADGLIDVVLEKYGAGNPVEKSIMTIVDLENKTGCFVKSVSFSDSALVYESVADAPAAEAAEGEAAEAAEPEAEISVYRQIMSLTVGCGYTQMKKVFDYINSNDERMTVEDFSITYNKETGMLNFGLNVNLYSVVDDKHEYVPITIEDVSLGNENIFKTSYANALDLLLDILEGAEGEEGASAEEGADITAGDAVTDGGV